MNTLQLAASAARLGYRNPCKLLPRSTIACISEPNPTWGPYEVLLPCRADASILVDGHVRLRQWLQTETSDSLCEPFAEPRTHADPYPNAHTDAHADAHTANSGQLLGSSARAGGAQ